MSEEDFRHTVAIFDAAKRGIRNDASLGDFLVELGAALMALGVQENKTRRFAHEANRAIWPGKE